MYTYIVKSKTLALQIQGAPPSYFLRIVHMSNKLNNIIIVSLYLKFKYTYLHIFTSHLNKRGTATVITYTFKIIKIIVILMSFNDQLDFFECKNKLRIY